MGSKIKTRPASVKDANAMSVIHARSWKKAYQGLISDEFLNGIEETKWVDMLTKGLGDETMKAWVATHEDEIVGCVCVGDSLWEGYKGQLEVISIYVLPEYWKFGVGSLLINNVLEYAHVNEYSEIGLWVLEGNTRAVEFYERNGFVDTGNAISFMIGENPTTEKRYVRK